MTASIYDFSARLADGTTVGLDQYRGQVLLIVNTASQCGFTPQYAGLESLQRQFHTQGFNVLAFPCNQFGAQEPGSDEQIVTFCQTNYDVSFPIFAKIDVNGDNAHPLYQFLKRQAKGVLGSEAIKWNFTKFLIDRQGNIVGRYAPTTTPEEITFNIAGLCDS